MFHRACNELRTSLLARIGDLERSNIELVDKLGEEREKAAERERELLDRLIAIANPLAARMIGSARSNSPAAVPPPVERGSEQPASRRIGVRPLLTPAGSGFRPDLMERQRQRELERAATAAAPPAEEEMGTASTPSANSSAG
jgi:hypothetical protein